MLAHLADVSIRSLLLVLAAAIVLWIPRIRRTAALQHAVWTAVLCGMLVLLAFGQSLPQLPMRILDTPTARAAPPTVVLDFDRSLLAGTSQPSTPFAAKPRRTVDWKDVALYAWGVVAFVFLAQYATGMFLVRKLAATGRSIRFPGSNGVYESDRVSVPVTVLWLRPRILLPPEWRQWDREKLDAVLAHEGAHVRRRDALVAALAGVNRSLFWFHPLAWIMERKLALLADQACDEACVAALGGCERYANLLLEMARVVDRSQGRLRRHALTMAAGSHIRRRIDSLLQEGRTFSRGLTWTGWAAVMLCGVPVVFGAGALQLDRRPPLLQLDLPRWTPPAPHLSAPRSVVQIAQAQVSPAQATLPPAPAPKFDSATITPCAQGDGAGRAGRGGGGGRGIPVSPPGELYVNCMSVWELVNRYVGEGNAPLLNNARGIPADPQRVRGGPAWLYSDLYTIDAGSSDPVANVPDPRGNANLKLLSGPMLQALLEDRFQLRTHREVEEVPMYALTVASSGFKLQPMEEGGCIPRDPAQGVNVREMFPPNQKPLCIYHVSVDGQNWTMDAAGQSLSKLAGALGGIIMHRPVLDKTGITALFTFHLEFAHDENAPGVVPPEMRSPFPPSDVIPTTPSINTVLEQQLGLTLVPDRGPREYLVIDSAERPSLN
jgi:uncharacterized protein (TIGR03435 family)